MFLLPFLFNKAVLIGLSLVVVGSTTVYGGIKAGEYRDTQIILQEAQQLSSEGKYQAAISKLTATGNKWSPKGIKEEIKREIDDNKLLAESSKNYELGKELFDKGNYKDTLEVLKKVDIRNKNYPSAKSLIELAESKTEETKGQVAGITSQTEAKVKTSTPIETPAPIPSSTPIPTPTPQPAPTIDPGKTAELRNLINDMERQANIAASANVQIQFYQEGVSACLNHVSETINNAPMVGGSKLNYSPSQIQSMKDACNNSTINNLSSTYNVAMQKIQEDTNRANILAAECPKCWEEAQK